MRTRFAWCGTGLVAGGWVIKSSFMLKRLRSGKGAGETEHCNRGKEIGYTNGQE
jgi:hypothetical protein